MKKQERPFVVKTLLKCLALLAFALPLAFASCSSSSDGDDDWDWDDEDFDPDYIEVLERVEYVTDEIDEYYDKSETLEEMASYLNEIKKIRYVEDAYDSGSELFVEIKDYGTISYSFFLENQTSSIQNTNQLVSNLRARHLAPTTFVDHPIIGSKKVLFASQYQFDESEERQAVTMMAEYIRSVFERYGFEVSNKLIAPDVDFFKNKIFDYDIVYLLTHGGFNKKKGYHTFMTSEVLSDSNGELNLNILLDVNAPTYKYKDISTDYLYFTKHKETRNGKEVKIWYAMVTEKWIEDSSKRFPNDGQAIVFNSACLSMQGVGRQHSDSISTTVGEIFAEKGAGVYLGYDEENTIGRWAGLFFLCDLFSGMSIERAIEDLPFEMRHEFSKKDERHNYDYWADLIAYYNPKNNNFGKSCVRSPFFNLKYTDLSHDDELSIVLEGDAYYSEHYYFEEPDGGITYVVGEPIRLGSPVCYGFYLSKTEKLADAIELCRLYPGCDGFEQYGYDEENIYCLSFQHTLTYQPLMLGAKIAPQTTYYYWAYFYDGKEYYFSKPKYFTTTTIPSEGKGSVTNVPGTDF